MIYFLVLVTFVVFVWCSIVDSKEIEEIKKLNIELKKYWKI
jgi:hypothetical protein